MKTLQSNFTTPEQSKRLLELGIPIDSADMHIVYSSRDSYSAPKFNDIRVSAYRSYFPTLDILPCWSVGRLMEICKVCEPKKDYEQLCVELNYSKNYCVAICSHIIANSQIIDISKLEK